MKSSFLESEDTLRQVKLSEDSSARPPLPKRKRRLPIVGRLFMLA
jgi:hypothetical protein